MHLKRKRYFYYAQSETYVFELAAHNYEFNDNFKTKLLLKTLTTPSS